MNDDEVWAHDRLTEFPELDECASARVTIDGITHRALAENGTGWRTLCRSHRLVIWGQWFKTGGTGRFDVSTSDVDCLCCLPAGG